jgi:hypothetical protein
VRHGDGEGLGRARPEQRDERTGARRAEAGGLEKRSGARERWRERETRAVESSANSMASREICRQREQAARQEKRRSPGSSAIPLEKKTAEIGNARSEEEDTMGIRSSLQLWGKMLKG